MIKTAGYSNRWTYYAGPNNPDGGFTEQQWATLLREAKSIIQRAEDIGIAVAGPNGSGSPVLNENEISLNGDSSKGESYETFYLPRIPYDEGDGRMAGKKREVRKDWAKTDERPYDAVVTSILAAASKISKGMFVADSDGGKPKRTLASDRMVDRVVNQYLGITAKNHVATTPLTYTVRDVKTDAKPFSNAIIYHADAADAFKSIWSALSSVKCELVTADAMLAAVNRYFGEEDERGMPIDSYNMEHVLSFFRRYKFTPVGNDTYKVPPQPGLKTSNDRVIESIGDKGAWIADDDPYPRLVWVRDLNMPKFCLNKVTNGYFLDVLYSNGMKLYAPRAESFEDWVPQLKAIASGANPKEFGLKSAPSELPGAEWERDGYFITSNSSLVMERIGSPVGKIRATFFGKYVWETQAPWVQEPLIRLGKLLVKQFYQKTLQMSRLDGDWKRVL